MGVLVIALFVLRRLTDPATGGRPGALLLATMIAVMILGAIPPSVVFQFNVNAPSLDRYLLPAITLGIVLATWAVQAARLSWVLVVPLLALMAAFSVAGTRDAIELQSAVWRIGRYANDHGIRNDQLDGGAAYTRHFVAFDRDPVEPVPGADVRWWVGADGKTSGQYAITYSPLPGYRVVRRFPVGQWLTPDQTYLYLLEVQAPA